MAQAFQPEMCERCGADGGIARKEPFAETNLCSGCVQELQPVVDDWMRHRSRVSTRRLGQEMRADTHENVETKTVLENRPDDALSQVRQRFSESELEDLNEYTAVVVVTRDD